MKRIVISGLILAGLLVPNYTRAQQQTPSTSTPIGVKSSASEDALINLSKQAAGVQKDIDATKKSIEDARQQAIYTLDQKNKPIVEAAKAKAKKWQDKIDADTKEFKTQIEKNNTDAQTEYNNGTADLTKKLAGLQSLVPSPGTLQTLIDVVKEQEKLPPGSTFDIKTQTWSVPAAPKEDKK